MRSIDLALVLPVIQSGFEFVDALLECCDAALSLSQNVQHTDGNAEENPEDEDDHQHFRGCRKLEWEGHG
ncbi:MULTISPECIES: hypothetical protein [Salinibaculum]|uniref:hypothetical protein n=1 Tax=Salinibaculum TaxID=2732368 RepID=UPI0030D1404F